MSIHCIRGYRHIPGGERPQGRLDAAHLYEDRKRLKKENALLKEARDILKKAAASFAVPSRYSTPG